MAFTNTWDDAFPTDTELANLIGANLRQLRVDTQQRMAAISGLDAARPNFAGDTQPNSWNGILYFATDSGRTWVFSNPTWIEVTGKLLSSRIMSITTANLVINPSITVYLATGGGESATESLVQVPMPVALNVRGMAVNTHAAQPGSGGCTLTLRKNGVSQALTVTIAGGAAAGVYTDYNLAHLVPFNVNDLLAVQYTNNSPTNPNSTLAGLTLVY